jgi:hypothetical protein
MNLWKIYKWVEKMNEEAIEYLLFTVKQTEDSIVDVGIDFEQREYRMETTDLYGQLLGAETQGKLRRSKVRNFKEALKAMDFCTWPQNEKDTLPLYLKNASILYNIGGEQRFTTGNNEEDLRKIHKMLEELVGTTFGSYEFY